MTATIVNLCAHRDNLREQRLDHTLKAIFMDGVRHRENGGKCSRSLAPAAQGFLYELARHINEGVGGWPGRFKEDA